MTATLYYLFQVIACSAIFTGYYWLVLRNGHFYQWNRYYILISVLFSVLVPLLDIPIMLPNITMFQVTLGEMTQQWDTTLAANPANRSFNYAGWELTVWGMVCVGLLTKEVISILRVVRLRVKAPVLQTNGTKLYLVENPSAPFTFFQTIFWKKNVVPDSVEGQYMLRHELAHVRLGHSRDKALMQLCCCLFWMNPFFFLLRRELELVHEFAADKESVGSGNAEGLSSLILCTMYADYYHNFTSHFFQSSIKRRIIMITNNKETSMGLIRKMNIIPVILIALYLFACQNEKTPDPEFEAGIPVKADGIAADATAKQAEEDYPEEVFVIAEVMPLFNGKSAEEGFREYVNGNTVYPAEAAEKGISGKVFIEFIIDAEGNVRNAMVIRAVNPLLDNEALRVARSSPKWTPGLQGGKKIAVKYTFPIVFKLSQ